MPNLTRVVLRNVAETDLAIFYEIQREPEGFKMAAVAPRDEEGFIRHWRENIFFNEEVITKAIELDGEVVGDILSFIQDDRRVIGYWIGKKYWGRGVTTAALGQFLASHEKRRPLSAFAAVANVASYRVLQKCGFHQVGNAALASDGVEEFRMELS